MITLLTLYDFLTLLLAELHLRQRIHQLQEWRKAGISHLEEGETYENETSLRVISSIEFIGKKDRK